ncbi:MAG: hypothetical protein LBK54_03560 [Propionibacteriaceae bacterium]|nr:hypothetical protein [Propionibacteriaceae bacterium]
MTGLTVAIGLTGACSPKPAAEPTDTPTFPVSSETPSPEPTGPQPAAYDQFWTANQLAAVRMVERHQELIQAYYRGEMMYDGVPDLDPIYGVSAMTDWSEMIARVNQFAISGQSITGPGVVFTMWNVSSETTNADGAQQITVVTCADPSLVRVIDATGNDVTNPDRHQILETYTVQWVEEQSDWRVVLSRSEDTLC